MIQFVLFSLLLVALAGAFVVPTLWRAGPQGIGASPNQRPTAILLLSALVLLTGWIYTVVGAPQALGNRAQDQVASNQASAASTEEAVPDVSQAQIEAMVARLAQRLQSQPNDPEGWHKLVRSYETLGRFPEAVDAYQHLMSLQHPDAELLTNYAVALGMSQGRTLVGEPEKVLDRALTLDPSHIQALALSGSAAMERADYDRAVLQWRKILKLVPEGDDTRARIERDIEKALSLQKGSKR